MDVLNVVIHNLCISEQRSIDNHMSQASKSLASLSSRLVCWSQNFHLVATYPNIYILLNLFQVNLDQFKHYVVKNFTSAQA